MKKRKIITLILLILLTIFSLWMKSHYKVIFYGTDDVVLKNGIIFHQQNFRIEEISIIKKTLESLSFTGLVEPRDLLLQSTSTLGHGKQAYGFVFVNNPDIKIYLHTRGSKTREYIDIFGISCTIGVDCLSWLYNMEDIIYRSTTLEEVTDIATQQGEDTSFALGTGGLWIDSLKISMNQNGMIFSDK